MDPSRSEGQLRYLCAGAVLAIGTVGELAAQMSTPLLPPLATGIQPRSITSATLPIWSKEWCRSIFCCRRTSPRNPTESSWCSRGRLAPEELGDP
jgi:hypothetical protein